MPGPTRTGFESSLAISLHARNKGASTRWSGFFHCPALCRLFCLCASFSLEMTFAGFIRGCPGHELLQSSFIPDKPSTNVGTQLQLRKKREHHR